MNTSEQKSISKPAAEEDDFDFYGWRNLDVQQCLFI
jgi:hypothetical protein